MKLQAMIFACLVPCVELIAKDYQQEFDNLKQGGEAKKIEALLTEWRKKETDKPDALIAAANYFFNSARNDSPTISTKPAEKNDFVVADPKSGKPVGSIAFEIRYDKAKTKKAINALRIAAEKFPQRLDIRCGIAFMQQETGDF